MKELVDGVAEQDIEHISEFGVPNEFDPYLFDQLTILWILVPYKRMDISRCSQILIQDQALPAILRREISLFAGGDPPIAARLQSGAWRWVQYLGGHEKGCLLVD